MRTELKYWKQHGMPRDGPIFQKMSSARARCKYALRQCRLAEQCVSSEIWLVPCNVMISMEEH